MRSGSRPHGNYLESAILKKTWARSKSKSRARKWLPFVKSIASKTNVLGSVLREDFKSTSDVDVLVEFENGHTPGLAFFAYLNQSLVARLIYSPLQVSRKAGFQSAAKPYWFGSAQVYYVAR